MREKVVGTLQTYMPSGAGLLTAIAAVLIGCAWASAQQNSLEVGQSWPDRRPLGRIIFARSEAISDTNLNGWASAQQSSLEVGQSWPDRRPLGRIIFARSEAISDTNLNGRASAQQNSLDVGQSWPDRRPLGRIIFARSEAISDTNLNGWANGGPSNLGVAAFQADILGQVNNAIHYTQQMHGQGIIIWDVNGCGCTNLRFGNVQYLGDPRFLAPFAGGLTVQNSYSPYVPSNSPLGLNGVEPAMDAIADQAFTAIRSAGLRCGVCIRAQKIEMSGNDIENAYTSTNLGSELYYDTIFNQLADLDAKLTYAYSRWGCRIFYVDSNTSSDDVTPLLQNQLNPTFSPAYVYTQLHLRHPDCLIFPEQTFDGAFVDASLGISDPPYQYLKVASRYSSFSPVSSMAPFLSSSELTAVPDAFTLISCANLGTSDTTDTPNVIYALQHNQCILMAEAWYNSPGITLIINWQTSAGVNGF
jgi:hypothetical protein